MKARIGACIALAVLHVAPTAQAGALAQAIADAHDGQWIAYRTPLVEGATAPCCLGHLREGGACRLDAQDWMDLDARPPAGELHVFLQVRDGRIARVRPYAPQCPLAADAPAPRWIATVDEAESIASMADLAARGATRTSSASIATLALHADARATDALDTLMREAVSMRVRRDAAFWLAQGRGEDGFERVRARFAAEPAQAMRQHLVFCLSRSPSPRAAVELRRIAVDDPDPEVRGDSLLWIAQSLDADAGRFIAGRSRVDPAPEARRRAVFALSQLPAAQAIPALDGIAGDRDAPRELRREALFWLVQSDDEAADARLRELLGSPRRP